MLTPWLRWSRELSKKIAYMTPGLRGLMTPRYRYKLDPAQLAAMVRLIDDTRDSGGAIAEIGVARGDTSVFLLEHLKTVGDPRPLYLFDTFDGFTRESIAYEVRNRGKLRADLNVFRYGNQERLRANLTRAGYTNFRIVPGDAAQFDWSRIGPIAAVLLDVDLYLPTKAILEAVYPRLVPGGGILVDDCTRSDPRFDGALEACLEFEAEHRLTFLPVGGKGRCGRSSALLKIAA